MWGMWLAGPVIPDSFRQPTFMAARSSRESPAQSQRCAQKSSHMPVCRKCRYASQIAMSSTVVLECSFWCHCPRKTSSIPGRWPSLMPWVRRMFRIPIRMSSPFPPPRGSVPMMQRNMCRTKGVRLPSPTARVTFSAKFFCR